MPNAGEAAAPVPSVDLDAIAAPAFAPADADYESQIEHDKLDREHKTLQNRAFAQNISLRGKYAALIFGLTFLWLAGVYLMLLFEGFHFHGFNLTEKEVLAAITSTTANVIAVLVIVVKYLFPNPPARPPKG
jgi:hypothetical protein